MVAEMMPSSERKILIRIVISSPFTSSTSVITSLGVLTFGRSIKATRAGRQQASPIPYYPGAGFCAGQAILLRL
jgi:hypothetical protein